MMRACVREMKKGKKKEKGQHRMNEYRLLWVCTFCWCKKDGYQIKCFDSSTPWYDRTLTPHSIKKINEEPALSRLSFLHQVLFFTRFLVMILFDSPMLANIIIGGIFVLVTNAALVELNWNITYTIANPDGLYERRVIGVNGQWP